MVQALFPLIDGITGVLLSGLEALKGYFGVKVAEHNAKIHKIAMQEDEAPKRMIGFNRSQINEEEEEEEE